MTARDVYRLQAVAAAAARAAADGRSAARALETASAAQHAQRELGGIVYRVPAANTEDLQAKIDRIARRARRANAAPIRLRDVQARGLGCKPAKRIARRCVSGRGPGGSGWTIFEVDDRVTLSRRAQRVAFTLGNVRQSCAPSG